MDLDLDLDLELDVAPNLNPNRNLSSSLSFALPLLLALAACGSDDADSDPADDTGDSGAQTTAVATDSSGVEPTTTGPVDPDTTAADPDSTTSDVPGTDGGSTGGGVIECNDPPGDLWVAYGYWDPQGPYDVHDGPCTVADVFYGLDSVAMDLTCPDGDHRIGGGGDEDLMDYFTVGDEVMFHAEGNPDEGWENLAILDGDGDLILGVQDLNPLASDFSEWLEGTTFQVLDTDCPLEEERVICPIQRLALDLALEDDAALLQPGQAAVLEDWRVYATWAARVFPGRNEGCPEEAVVGGRFVMVFNVI